MDESLSEMMDELMPRLSRTFKARTEQSGECLIWMGATTANGYGSMRIKNKGFYAHRVAWEMEYGQIPIGAQVDHSCWNRACVNTDHLRLATKSQNMSNRSLDGFRSSTGVRNVRRNGPGFGVELSKNGVRHWLGTFPTLKEAEQGAKNARRDLFEEFAGRDEVLS